MICIFIFILLIYESHEISQLLSHVKRVKLHFVEYEGNAVMDAIKTKVPQQCLNVSFDQGGGFISIKYPHMIFNFNYLNNSLWQNMTNLPIFGHGCYTILLKNIPSSKEYKKLYLLRKKGAIIYYIIHSKDNTNSLQFLRSQEFKKEENIVVINRKEPLSWTVQMRQMHSPQGYLKLIKSDLWSPRVKKRTISRTNEKFLWIQNERLHFAICAI